MKNSINIIIVLTVCISQHIWADVPLKGTTMPPNVRDAMKIISRSYQSGGLARMMRERKKLRHQGIINRANASKYQNSIKLPLLLGSYSDTNNRYSKNEFQNKIFDNNPSGTMIDYYKEISYGQLILSGNTYGWYSAPHSQSFYVGGNSGLEGGGARFTLDLVKASDASTDFSQFDSDGDGYVEAVMVVHTGTGAEAQPSAYRDNIWSHRWNFNSAHYYYPDMMPEGEYTTNDPWPGHPGEYIKINDYIIQPEEVSYYDQSIIDIGVFCHEFGHALGLPDLYDTDGSSEGVGQWCLMSGGSYGADGDHPESPAHMSAWCKEELGWISPINVSNDMRGKEILNVEENQDAVYKIWRDGSPAHEYFLVENRQPIGYDTYICSPGILIWHIDQDIIDSNHSQNTVNADENHKGVDLEAADGRQDLDNCTNQGDDGDPFPGSSNNTLFNGNSNPHSRDYLGLDTGVEVSNIALSDQIVIADLIIGSGGGGTNIFTVYNDGNSTLTVNRISSNKNWLSASPSTFQVSASASKDVQALVDWNQLASQQSGILTVSSDDPDEPAIAVKITAIPKQQDTPVLSVTPEVRNVSHESGTTTFSVSNSGSGTMNWNAVSNDSWLTITNGQSGTNSGTVKVNYTRNSSTSSRAGTITVTAFGADGSPTTVTVNQVGGGNYQITWDANLTILDSGDKTGTLVFGQGDNATDDIDAGYGEIELPPIPPTGVFDARFELPVMPIKGSHKDYRNDIEEAIVWRCSFQPGGGGYPFEFTWNSRDLPDGSFFLKDAVTGTIVNVNMKTANSYTLSNQGITTLLIEHSKESCMDVHVVAGWNIISVPLVCQDMRTTVLFPDASSNAFEFKNGYFEASSLECGKGYWLKFNTSTSVDICGSISNTLNIDVQSGWNIIGPFESAINTASITSSPTGIIASDFFAFHNGYVTASTLQPGKGYWVKASAKGQLFVGGSQSSAKNDLSAPIDANWPQLVFSDAAGQERVLYLATASITNSYELPPAPPQDVFDVRFADNKYVNDFESSPIEINLNANHYPLHVSCRNVHEKSIRLLDPFGGRIFNRELQTDQNICITEPLSKLILQPHLVPESFQLAQNYPNPFNPKTELSFSVPEESHVNIIVYNALGERVVELTNKTYAPGQYKVPFDGQNYSSGLYLYVMQAGDFKAVKKMAILK